MSMSDIIPFSGAAEGRRLENFVMLRHRSIRKTINTMKAKTTLFLFLLNLSVMMSSHALDEVGRTEQASDHFLMYMMGFLGGTIGGTIVVCRTPYIKAYVQRHDFDDREENFRRLRQMQVLVVFGGIIIGSAVGYLLECVFRQPFE